MINNFYSKISRTALRLAFIPYKIFNKLRRPVSLGAAVAIFNDLNEVLLVKHSYRKGWGLPAGGVKRGESVQETACREMREELGITIKPKDLNFKGIFYHRCDGKHDHVVLFEVKNFHATVTPDNFEILDARFFKLPQDISSLESLQNSDDFPDEICGDFGRLILSCLVKGEE